MPTPTKTLSGVITLLALLTLTGCSLAPLYQRPTVTVPAAFKEAASEEAALEEAAAKQAADQGQQGSQGEWKAAQPAEEAHRGEWWKIFADPVLDDLENQALLANQDLKAAAARLGQARALEQSARAALLPQLNAGFGPSRQLPSAAAKGLPADGDSQAYTLWRTQASFSYEADLFGRVSTLSDAARFDAERNQALFRSTLLALQADVAQAYFLLRELDSALALYGETVTLRGETLALVQRRFDAGDIGELDLARAQTDYASAKAEALGLSRQRAVAEHALAILLGKAPADFSLPPLPLQALARGVPAFVPASLPSALLERRPDIAAAERAMAAANARIGNARAAYFPRLSLTGSLGYESNELGDLFKQASRTFAFGPLVGTLLSLPLFDGGAREAGVNRASAVYEEEVANYRQTLLKAFKEVEDGLANLRLIDQQKQEQDRAVHSASRAAHLARLQYREGAVAYFNVLDANRSALQQQRGAIQLEGERARTLVSLVRALGGGWEGQP